MDAIDRMLTEVGEVQLAVEPRMEKKRQALLAGALSLYQQILSQKELDRIRRETAQAHRRMADIFRLLGEHEKAIDAYSEARGLLEQLLVNRPRTSARSSTVGELRQHARRNAAPSSRSTKQKPLCSRAPPSVFKHSSSSSPESRRFGRNSLAHSTTAAFF